MPSFLAPRVVQHEESRDVQQSAHVIWSSYLRDISLAEGLWNHGYSFIVLGRDVHYTDDLECGEPIALMMVVLKDGIPVDPLKLSVLRNVLVDADDYERESLSMFVRLASWSKGRIQGPMELYVHSPHDNSHIVPIEARELTESFVCMTGCGAAPVVEFDPRYLHSLSVGTIQKARGRLDDRLCVKAHGVLYSVR